MKSLYPIPSCAALQNANQIRQLFMEEPFIEATHSFSPGLSGVGRFRLHKDQVRSRETANKSRELGEKAICVTVRVWHIRVCS